MKWIFSTATAEQNDIYTIPDFHPQYPALQPQADTVKENKRIDTQHVTSQDKISDISHTSRILWV